MATRAAAATLLVSVLVSVLVSMLLGVATAQDSQTEAQPPGACE
eukprot:SAG22_NODE_12229_length_451_cov_0.988636_1_plen_43_part_01